tara:strand:+ start:795 stop:923 length:129 start_codon:yes stop_codon:yes gene_type:complete
MQEVQRVLDVLNLNMQVLEVAVLAELEQQPIQTQLQLVLLEE